MSKSSISIGDISAEELTMGLEKVDSNSEHIDILVDKLVQKYCGELDNFIRNVYTLISDKSVDVPDVDIEYMIMQLPCLMYFTSDKLESLGIREDIAKGLEKEVYSSVLLKTEGRVSEKESAAQIASQQEALITSINSRAYRKIRARLDYAMETLGSLKKVIANRIANKGLSVRDS